MHGVGSCTGVWVSTSSKRMILPWVLREVCGLESTSSSIPECRLCRILISCRSSEEIHGVCSEFITAIACGVLEAFHRVPSCVPALIFFSPPLLHCSLSIDKEAWVGSVRFIKGVKFNPECSLICADIGQFMCHCIV